FVPGLIQKYKQYIDDWVTVSSDEAIEMARRIARRETLGVGISSGANVVAAIKLAEKHGFGEGDRVVTILPDYAARYFSTRLFLKRRLTTEEHERMLELARED
ncbi:MAG: pyridoxal-phosphate dependent enzyme, partial [Thermococcus sp.]